MWIDIKGYEGVYQINEHGVIKRLGTHRFSKGRKDKFIKYEPNNCGYLRATLCVNNNPKRYLVHKLVYQTFIGNIEKGLTINHKDSNKINNNLVNLEMITSIDNNRLKKCTKLDINKVKAIRESKLTTKEVALIYRISPRTVTHVRNYTRWANI